MRLLSLVLLVSACSHSDSAAPAADPDRAGTAGAERQLSPFDGVELAGSIDVEVTIGGVQHVEVVADPALVPLVTTEVKDHGLVVSTKPEFRGGHVVVRVSLPAIARMRLTGSGNMQLDGVHADDLALEVIGSGDLKARGAVRRVVIAARGSGSVAAKTLTSDDAEVQVTGSGSVDVDAAKSLAAHVTGSGTIHYFGNPPAVSKQTTGSGAIEPG